MQFRFRCAAVLTAVLLCSAAALPALAEETATPETADSVASVSTYTGWKTVNGKDYWYENGVKQGTTGRGKEIYDPDSNAWYWLDAKQGGAKAVNKDVYQESNGGKWVRYDANGHMIKGWDTNDDGTYYFDLITGAMAKGDIVVDNLPCSFDTTTGIGCNLMWHSMDGKDYWYEAGKRQGYDPNNAAYRGKEIYDPASDAWYWLDNVQQGCGQTAAQSNVPKPDASQSRVRIYESMVELEDDSPLIITGEISRTSVIRDIDDITDFTLLDVKVSQTLKGTVNSGSIIVRQTGSAEQGSAETLLQTGDVVMLFLTPTDLPGEQSSQYYVTGATAGVYRVTDDTQQSWNVLRSQHGNASDAWQPVFERVNVDSGDELPSELTPAQVYEQVKD